jgi:hypothetical protein
VLTRPHALGSGKRGDQLRYLRLQDDRRKSQFLTKSSNSQGCAWTSSYVRSTRSRLLPYIVPSVAVIRANRITVQQLTDENLPSHYPRGIDRSSGSAIRRSYRTHSICRALSAAFSRHEIVRLASDGFGVD